MFRPVCIILTLWSTPIGSSVETCSCTPSWQRAYEARQHPAFSRSCKPTNPVIVQLRRLGVRKTRVLRPTSLLTDRAGPTWLT